MNNEQLTGKSDQHIHWFSENTGIHQEVVEPWKQLCHAANKQGYDLTIASGFRSFERQLSIWNRKFSGELAIKDIDNQHIDISTLSEHEIIQAILTFSALPGASRHHWGTDVDVYDRNALPKKQSLQLEPWEYQKNGPFDELTQWLKEHARNYGFYFPYDKFRGGIAAEPWHLSYFPLANQCQDQFTPLILSDCLKVSNILGKPQVIGQLGTIMTKYILNIGHSNHG